MTKLGLIVQLTVALSIVGSLAVPTQAEDRLAQLMGEHFDGTFSSQTLAQTPLVQITDVRLEETDAGLQVVLETPDGELSTPTTTVSGDALIIEIPNAALIGEDFEQFEPAEGIAVVQVSSRLDDQVEVVITGEDAPPTADIRTDEVGLTLSVVPGIAQVGETDEPLRIVVTGEENEGYNPSRASTATRTDTPLRDIPQSIQVIPQEVLEDRNVRTVNEAVETVSSVARGSRIYGNVPITGSRIIRGFDQGVSGVTSFRNGFPDTDFFSLVPIATVESVEVLRGPASVLFGAGEPGGIINVTTRQPLDEPYYKLAFEAGNNGLYQPSADLSGPLTANNTALYRFIASYQASGDFQGFADNDLTTIAPSITLNLGEQTELDLYYEYTHLVADPSGGLTNAAILSDGSLTSRDFATYYPELSLVDIEANRFGYALEHEVSDHWQLRNNVAINLTNTRENAATGFGVSPDDLFLGGFDPVTIDYQRNNLFAQIDLVGEFETGTITHQV